MVHCICCSLSFSRVNVFPSISCFVSEYVYRTFSLKIHYTVRNIECLISRLVYPSIVRFKGQNSLFQQLYTTAIETWIHTHVSVCVILKPIIRIKFKSFLFVVIIFTSFFAFPRCCFVIGYFVSLSCCCCCFFLNKHW